MQPHDYVAKAIRPELPCFQPIQSKRPSVPSAIGLPSDALPAARSRDQRVLICCRFFAVSLNAPSFQNCCFLAQHCKK